MYIIIVSLADPVSRAFLELMGDLPLVETRGDLEIRRLRDTPVVVYRGEPTSFDKEDVLLSVGKHAVFISRHEMANPRPIFTVHTPGSWPDVSVSNPHLASAVLRALCNRLYEPFECAYEATHHTPNTAHISATFVEVGSTDREWGDRKAVGTLLEALEEVLNSPLEEHTPAMVIGDLHYTTVKESALRKEVDIGHVVPKYVEITPAAVETALRKHTVPIKRAILFRKNVKNPARGEILQLLRDRGVEVVLKG